MLFLRFTINVMYARNINGICFIYTIILMTMLLFLSVVLLQVNSWSQLFNLFTWHYIYKLFAKNCCCCSSYRRSKCLWMKPSSEIHRPWGWGGKWLHCKVFSAPATLVLRAQHCPKADIPPLSAMISGSTGQPRYQYHTANKYPDNSFFLFRWIVSLTDLFSYRTMILKKDDAREFQL